MEGSTRTEPDRGPLVRSHHLRMAATSFDPTAVEGGAKGEQVDGGRAREGPGKKGVEVVVFHGDRAHAPDRRSVEERRRRKDKGEDEAKVEAEDKLRKEAFEDMKREVLQFGGRNLEGDAKKRFESERLRSIGARAAKSPRTPASVGLGLAQKRKQRVRSQLERDVASGAVSKKGSGKVLQRRLETLPGRTNGASEGHRSALNAHAAVGSYRGGVLHLHPARQGPSRPKRGRR